MNANCTTNVMYPHHVHTHTQLLLAADAAPWIQVQPFYDTVAGAEQGSEPNIKQAEALLQRSASNKAAAHTFETARMTAASFVASLLAIRHGSAPSAEHTASTTVPADSFAEELGTQPNHSVA